MPPYIDDAGWRGVIAYALVHSQQLVREPHVRQGPGQKAEDNTTTATTTITTTHHHHHHHCHHGHSCRERASAAGTSESAALSKSNAAVAGVELAVRLPIPGAIEPVSPVGRTLHIAARRGRECQSRHICSGRDGARSIESHARHTIQQNATDKTDGHGVAHVSSRSF